MQIRPFDHQFRRLVGSFGEAAARAWNGRFLGRRGPAHFAAAAESRDWADYHGGDDYRYVDWYLCARHDELLSKTYRGNEQQCVYLLVDCSPSMALGSPRKLQAATTIAAALAYLAVRHHCRVGAAAVSDRILSLAAPQRGPSAAARLFEYLGGLSPDASPKHLAAVLREFTRRRRQAGIVVLVSDLFDSRAAAGRPDNFQSPDDELFFVQLYDAWDANPDVSGRARLHYVESGTSRRTYVHDGDLQHYRDEFRRFLRDCQRYCQCRSIGLAQVDTRLSLPGALQRILRSSSAPARPLFLGEQARR